MVLKDFDPPKGGRGIKLKRNQSIFILHKGEENWWFARTSAGQVGWVPREIVDSTEPQDVSCLLFMLRSLRLQRFVAKDK